ncbi:MAG: hypothetical protein K0Q93_2729 [Nocardioidaceae bacterium]|jgi:hypothetical protein|nr:hypothetical protein [Nocardioidaceae bacterium]
MARNLTANVNVDGTWYGPSFPDAKVTADVEKAISNEKVWTGSADAPTVESTDVKEPPRKGPGSGQEAWVNFARVKGVTETFDSKDALIAHLEDAGHITKG